jgi:hyperosmotically inducible periplasmic protein
MSITSQLNPSMKVRRQSGWGALGNCFLRSIIVQLNTNQITLRGFVTLCLSIGLLGVCTVSKAGGEQVDVSTSAAQLKQQDRDLARKVRGAIVRSSPLTSSNIFVIVKNGVVSLEGSVPESGQIQIADAIAASVPGVTSVQDYLSIRMPGGR